MRAKSPLTPDVLASVEKARARGERWSPIAARVGRTPGSIRRALAARHKADDYDTSSPPAAPQRRQAPTYSWTMERIREARDAQMSGNFGPAVALAQATKTDDAIFTAYHNRIAPQSAIRADVIAHASTRGAEVVAKLKRSVTVERSVLGGIGGRLADHGLAIGYNMQTPNDAGTCVDFRLTEWPLEHVRWDNHLETLYTQTRDGQRVNVTHGDGRWTVFAKFQEKPWLEDAAILPVALIWAAHAEGVADWAGTAATHAMAKIIGELPEGHAARQQDGTLTPQASAFLTMLEDIVSGRSGAAIQPFGSKVDFIANTSTAWQIFMELLQNREKAAARVYTGTDASLGSVGGAPGVDIATLFGVAATKVQGDFDALEQGVNVGVYQPWTAINYGDTRLSPALKYQMPDPDSEKKSAENSSAYTRLTDAITALRAVGLAVDQEMISVLAGKFGVSPVPVLAETGAEADVAVAEETAPV